MSTHGRERTQLRVLMVEDDPDDAALIERELSTSGLGIAVTRVETPDALRGALEERWDVVLCDYSLPALTGSEALGIVLDSSRDLPVIVVSGAIGEDHAVSMMRAGARDFIHKDRMARLLPAIEREMREAAVRHARRRAEEAYATLVERSLQGLVIVQDERVRFANPAAARIVGWSREVMLSWKEGELWRVVPGDVRDAVRHRFGQLAAGGEGSEPTSIPIRRADGEERWIEVYPSRIQLEGRRAVQAALVDVTDRRRLAEAIRRGKEEWERTFDAVRELIALTDPDGAVVRLNRSFADQVGSPIEGLVGSRLSDLMGVDDGLWQADALAPGETRQVEVTSERLGGRFQVSTTARTDRRGRLTGAIHVARDVTVQREAEEIVRRQLTIEQADLIFRTVRHELGNALNTLKTTLTVLARNVDRFDRERRDVYFQRCLDAYQVAEGILTAVRTYQHLDEVHLRSLDVAEFLHAKVDLLFETARARGVVCSARLPERGVVVYADPEALLRVLLNVVDNAAAAVAGVAGPAVDIELETVHEQAVLTVRDNGCGMDSEQVARAFSPFFTTKPTGSGMGLAIVQKLMVRMNGVARIRSSKEGGTAVELRLPVVADRRSGAPRHEIA